MRVAGVDVGRKRDRTVAVRAHRSLVDGFATIVKDFTFREQAEHLNKILQPCSLVMVDCTGIGQGLFECLQDLRLPVVRCIIIAGDKVNLRGDTITVGKTWLMQRCKARPIMIDPQLAGSKRLREEVQQIRVRLSARGRPIYEPRTGHDDHVLAYALTLLAWDLFENGFKAERPGSEDRQESEGGGSGPLEGSGGAAEGHGSAPNGAASAW